MPYTSRYDGQGLTLEERDVATALASYATHGATRFDWTPTAKLWLVYRTWHANHRWRCDPDDPMRLTLRQFGRAIRRIFRNVSRHKRSYSGKPQWGYAGLVGPHSITTQVPRGRRSMAVAK